MKNIVAVLLIIGGLWLLYAGNQRRESVAGVSATVGAKIAAKFDGEPRVPAHTWYMVGGGLLVLVGAAMVLRKHSA